MSERATVIAAESLAMSTQCPNCGYSVSIPAGALQLEVVNPYAAIEPASAGVPVEVAAVGLTADEATEVVQETVRACNAFQGNTQEQCLKCGFSFDAHVLAAQLAAQSGVSGN